MEFNQIKELKELGFSNEDIKEMVLSGKIDSAANEPPAEQPTNNEPPKDNPPEEPKNNEDVASLKNEIAELKKAIQNQNIKDVTRKEKTPESADDVLANFMKKL